jgi:glycosyltransferase involved in cell wall biosynthesis
LRILTVSHFFEGHGGGIERVAGQLCRQFSRLGAKSVWAASGGDTLPNGEIESVPLPCMNPTERLTGLPMPIPGPRAMLALAREVRRSDAIVVHDALYATSILALMIGKACGKRVVLIQHIASIPFSSAMLRAIMGAANWLVTRPMLWAADTRVFISDAVRDDLLGTPARHPYELLFNGVDAKIFHPSEDRSSEPAAVFGMASRGDTQRVLFVGRYVEKKGLKILRELAGLRPDAMFVLVGNGPIRPSEWALANVHDLGPQSPEALADLYRWADLLVLPSVGEGYPLVIQEAMACGLPVVCGALSARADPGASRWLRGVRIDLSDPKASAQRCSETIDAFTLSPSERAAMAKYALRRYDWAAMARTLIALAQDNQSAALA